VNHHATRTTGGVARTLARVVLAAALMLGTAAQAEDIAALARLAPQPTVQAARAQLHAAEAALAAARNPWSASAQVGYASSAFNNPAPLTGTTTQDAVQTQLTLSVNPFPNGDSADAIRKAELNVQAARLAYRETLVSVQVAAVLAAAQVGLARDGLSAARRAMDVAEASLTAVRLQVARGAASAADARQAEAAVRAARERVQAGEENVRLALSGAAPYWGAGVPSVDAPGPPVPAEPPAVQRARLGTGLAELDLAAAQRALIPVVQVTYGRGPVSVSLDSRSLQPRATYTYSTREDPLRPAWSFSVGAAVEFGAGTLPGVDAVRARLAAAVASEQAARMEAALHAESLEVRLTQARRGVALAQAALADAERTLTETRAREQLGLVSPLVTARAALDVTAAQADVANANLNALNALLDLYRFYNRPLFEEAR